MPLGLYKTAQTQQHIRSEIFHSLCHLEMATHESRDYDYTKLAHTDSIRLVELLPGDVGSPLACNIVDARKNNEPKYEALSYAWGEPTMSHTVRELASQATLHITSNLSQALHAIRYENTPRVIWIDAICINQSDLREKGHQVALMGQIYRDAQRVVVFLGCLKITLNRLQVLVNELVQITQEWFYHSREGDGMMPKKVRRILRRISILRIFDQPWYNRVWVVQEYILARDIQWNVTEGELSAGLMKDAVESLQSIIHEDWIWSEGDLENLRVAGRRIHQLFSWRHKRLSGGQTGQDIQISSLASCLFQISAGRECNDPRDKLYALLAIVENHLLIKPDYTLSVSAVFADFAIRSLLKGDLTLLHASGLNPEIENGSSPLVPWTTNWDYVTNPLDIPQLRFSAAIMFPVKVNTFAANMVSIRGVRVDAVRLSVVANQMSSSSYPHYWGFVRQFLSNLIQPKIDLSMVEDQRRSSYYTPGYLNFANWFMFNRNQPNMGPISPYTNQDLRTTFWLLTTLETETSHSLKPAAANRARYPPTRPMQERWQKDCSIFMTEQGYLGYGPFWKKPNDQVVIFDGAVNPVLLRKAATKDGMDHWHLVGECYLLGWMHGDYFGHTVVDELPREGDNEHDKRYLVKEWFVLC
ncbi:hypothetical protein HBI56_162860 [Parastagonospora nodorum]|nr:hypothetical protein HBH53_159850 [Parastagonospora nodorum]KAH4342068.1 hypothetical protein HBH98_166670 [Parastagonospora nodorum]KAH4367235.1 hypothetical protein HBH97_163170 [Parastagonospora nodorum]KAH4389377.1 hypothetical protein HBH99_158640 [Parastagonospora nodorum]KAH4905825.1 hypothetical protein HBI80_088430 [Parastagonospora nodorum]